MQAIDLGKAKHYLKHLSQSYQEKELAERKRITDIHLNKKRLKHINKVEAELETGLEQLESKLSRALEKEEEIVHQQDEEKFLSKHIKEKIKSIEEQLDQFLVISHTKQKMKKHVQRQKQEKQREHLERKVKLKVGKPHERIIAMKETLTEMRSHLKNIKKTHPDSERVDHLSKRITSLRTKLMHMEKKTKK